MSKFRVDLVKERLRCMYEIRWHKKAAMIWGKGTVRYDRHMGRVEWLSRHLDTLYKL